MNRNFFDFQFIIGRGGFGKVWQVAMKRTGKKYALKEMSKVKIIDRRSEKSIKSEREFLSKLRHPFIVNMNCAFQDYENLYLVMDLLTGGDLRYHICKLRKFTEKESKFFISCLILGLEYIHNNNIIHRDIKPENLVFDDKGYLRITDFGVAKIRKEDNSSETSGTPGYMAPEVLLARNHSFPVDFFAIGVMGYELMMGQRPYLGRGRKEIKHQVIKKQAKIEEGEIPSGWSLESVDFINKCLKRKDSRRLGYLNGVSELKGHIWFKDYDWESLYNKTLISPFIPSKERNYDKKYCEAVEKISNETLERYEGYRNKEGYGKMFEGYTYINNEICQLTSGNETNTRITTNSKYSKPMVTTNPTAYQDNIRNKNDDLINDIAIFEDSANNTQKKNTYNRNILNNNDNIEFLSKNLLLSSETNNKLNSNFKLENKDKDDKNNSKYKRLSGAVVSQSNNNDTLLSNLVSSSTSLLNNNININQNIQKINQMIKPSETKRQMRSSSVGYFNISKNKIQSNANNSKRTKFIEYTGYNMNNNNNNKDILSNLNNNINDISNLINQGSSNNISVEQGHIKLNNKENIYDNYIQKIKLSNNENKFRTGIKNFNGTNSKGKFFLPQLNYSKNIIEGGNNYIFHSNSKTKNRFNISQLKFKINKKSSNMNNKFLIFGTNNCNQPIFKRSESTGFINLPMNINANKSYRIKNNYGHKSYISSSMLQNNNGGNEKKFPRNESDIFY